jgi:hypothetical protein
MHKQRRGARLFAIADREALRAEINRAIEKRALGNLSAAARLARIGQPELHRLAHGQIGSISRRTIAALRRLVPADRRHHLEEALVSPEASELLRAYDTWTSDWKERFLERKDLGDTYVGRAIQRLPGWELLRVLEVEHVLATARTEFPDEFRAFESFLVKQQASGTRARIAFYRILEPLFEGRESGFVERSWDELDRSELSRFIRAGMEREKILLRRSADTQRAQQQSSRDPVELVRLYGSLWDPRAFTGRRTHPLLKRYVNARRKDEAGSPTNG